MKKPNFATKSIACALVYLAVFACPTVRANQSQRTAGANSVTPVMIDAGVQRLFFQVNCGSMAATLVPSTTSLSVAGITWQKIRSITYQNINPFDAVFSSWSGFNTTTDGYGVLVQSTGSFSFNSSTGSWFKLVPGASSGPILAILEVEQ